MIPRDVSTLARRIVVEAMRGAIWAALEDAAVWEAVRDRIVRDWASDPAKRSQDLRVLVADAIAAGSPSRVIAERLATMVEWYEDATAEEVES